MRVDLLACRNALRYFNTEMQSRILTRFHFAPNDGVIRFLARADSLLSHASTLTPIDPQRRTSKNLPRVRA